VRDFALFEVRSLFFTQPAGGEGHSGFSGGVELFEAILNGSLAAVARA